MTQLCAVEIFHSTLFFYCAVANTLDLIVHFNTHIGTKNSKIFISFQTNLNLYYFPRIFCPTLSGTAQRYLHLKSKNPQQAFLRFLVKCIFHSGCERWLSYVVHANVLRDMESVLNEFHL